MSKFIRKTLLIVLLISFLIIPAYGESEKIERPIILIASGAPMQAYRYFIQLLTRAEINVDVLNDLHYQLDPTSFINFPVGEIESGKYKTAVFVFGAIGSDYLDLDTYNIKSVKIEAVIEDLKAKVDLCQKNGIITVGIQCYFSQKSADSKSYSFEIIEEIVPLMDSLVVLYNFGDFPELGDRFINVGKENHIPIEYFTDSQTPLTSHSGVVSILSTKF